MTIYLLQSFRIFSFYYILLLYFLLNFVTTCRSHKIQGLSYHEFSKFFFNSCVLNIFHLAKFVKKKDIDICKYVATSEPS